MQIIAFQLSNLYLILHIALGVYLLMHYVHPLKTTTKQKYLRLNCRIIFQINFEKVFNPEIMLLQLFCNIYLAFPTNRKEY